LELLDAREVRFELCGQRLHQLILRDADRLVDVAERVLGDDAVVGLAEQEADRRVVVLVAQQLVDRAQVEVQLARVLGLELDGLELQHHEAAQAQVIEEQVDVEVPPADLEMNLTPDEREASAQLQQELRDVRDERGLDVALLGLGAEREEVEPVGILQRLAREVRLRLGQPLLEVRDRLALALQGAKLDVMREQRPGPTVLDGAGRVEQPLLARLQLGEQRDVLTPRQLVNESLTHCARVGPSLRKHAHILEIRLREASHLGELDAQVGFDLAENPRSPSGLRLPVEDVASDLPVQLQQLLVHGERGALLCRADTQLHVGDPRGVAGGLHRRPRHRARRHEPTGGGSMQSVLNQRGSFGSR
jgi:hypothetical protein